MDMVFAHPECADAVEHLDFVERLDGRCIRAEASGYREAFERFNALHFLAPVVRPRGPAARVG